MIFVQPSSYWIAVIIMMNDCGGDSNEDKNDDNFYDEYRGGGDMIRTMILMMN